MNRKKLKEGLSASSKRKIEIFKNMKENKKKRSVSERANYMIKSSSKRSKDINIRIATLDVKSREDKGADINCIFRQTFGKMFCIYFAALSFLPVVVKDCWILVVHSNVQLVSRTVLGFTKDFLEWCHLCGCLLISILLAPAFVRTINVPNPSDDPLHS